MFPETGSIKRNNAIAREDLPAPVLPTMPIYKMILITFKTTQFEFKFYLNIPVKWLIKSLIERIINLVP